jgi:hypothetical protein
MLGSGARWEGRRDEGKSMRLFCWLASILVAGGGGAGAATLPGLLPGTAAYSVVPAGLDPLTADADSLARYGFPPRPDAREAPGAYESWRQAVEGVRRIVPVLQPVAIHHEPLRPAGASVGNGVAAASSNWSGFVAPVPAYSWGSQSATGIFGDWVVPIAQPAFNACPGHPAKGDVYSSTWVGIDGSGSGDVLQAGTESDAVCSRGQVGPYQGAWYEWYPYNEVRITNLPVTAGTDMYVHVWATSATVGHAYIANKSTKQSVSVRFEAPPLTQLIGNSAEWVVERPSVDGQLATLTNYVQEYFANARATTANGQSYFPGLGEPVGQPPALQINMLDDDNNVISTPALLGQDGIWFTDGGSAQHVPKG